MSENQIDKGGETPSKEYLFRYRWYISLLNFLQPGLGFASHKKWVDTVITFVIYIAGFYLSFVSLGDHSGPIRQVYIGVGLVLIAFIYSIVKPLLILTPDTEKNNNTNDNPIKSNTRVRGGITRFWLLQFLNRLWPGLGLLATRYWHIGLAIVLLGVGMYVLPSTLWPESQVWARKILFILTFSVAFYVTLKIFGYGGDEKQRTLVVIGTFAILSLLNVRYSDMIRDNYVLTVVGQEFPDTYGLRSGDLLISKVIHGSPANIPKGHLVLYGDNNYRENATIIPYSGFLEQDSVFAVTVQTVFPDPMSIGRPNQNFASNTPDANATVSQTED